MFRFWLNFLSSKNMGLEIKKQTNKKNPKKIKTKTWTVQNQQNQHQQKMPQ